MKDLLSHPHSREPWSFDKQPKTKKKKKLEAFIRLMHDTSIQINWGLFFGWR